MIYCEPELKEHIIKLHIQEGTYISKPVRRIRIFSGCHKKMGKKV